MEIRIGAKSPVYSARTTSKLSDPALKSSFAKMMAETKPVNQDTVEISGNPLAKRLEGVHQKIDGMDFNGKSSEEVYRSIIDAYEDEFGFSGILFYTDEDVYKVVDKDRCEMLESKIADYSKIKKGLHYRAMGYDKMSNAEKIAAINERVGGNSYCHQYAKLAELNRAGVITHHQCMTIFRSLTHRAEMEYCAERGIDYLDWSCYPEKYYKNSSEKWDKAVMTWASKAEVTWQEIFESVHDFSALHSWEKDNFFKEMEGITELLKGSDKI